MSPPPPDVPARYEPVASLGSGGGGEVWAVRDRATGRTVALKTLAPGAGAADAEALVREAVALSGLEGLGAPRVLAFGRLPREGRLYLVREIVEGRSLSAMLDAGADARACLEAVARVADQLTVLHRAGLLHGDVKPANVIVGPDGRATLVDLGLAAPLREAGSRVAGLTPRYAAPELFAGARLHVRAEIHALGATLREVLERRGADLDAQTASRVRAVVERATAVAPSERFPSADELASALRTAASLEVPPILASPTGAWPIVGLDAVAARLRERVERAAPGATLAVLGPVGSGRSVLLRRLAWTLGVLGAPVVWIERGAGDDAARASADELRGLSDVERAVVIVPDAAALDDARVVEIGAARARGAVVVAAADVAAVARFGAAPAVFEVPPLEADDAASLVRRAIPSLSDATVAAVVARAGARPGPLRALVRRLDGRTIVAAADLERVLDAAPEPSGSGHPREHARGLLDRGRFGEARAALASLAGAEDAAVWLLRARLCLGEGDAAAALDAISRAKAADSAAGGPDANAVGRLLEARARLRLGEYASARALATAEAEAPGAPSDVAEALAVVGLAESYLGEGAAAEASLAKAVEAARGAGDRRVESLARTSLALVLQRAQRHGEARAAYETALAAAEAADDAGAIATIRLNLAAIDHEAGRYADALGHLEAAVDMGRRAGRRATVEQALLNVAALDVYLGRYARARATLAELSRDRDALAPAARAQLAGVEADLAGRTGDTAAALSAYAESARAYDALGRGADAAEARLEGVLVSLRAGGDDFVALARELEHAEASLGDAPGHRALLALARGRLALARGDEGAARAAFDAANERARVGGQREWIWRSLEARAALAAASGHSVSARRDREEAVATLEAIASSLPRDVREVFWDDPRRKALRDALSPVASGGAVRLDALDVSQRGETTIARIDDRLARILEINREIAKLPDLPRLLDRVTDHAIGLLRAERGFVILDEPALGLVVHASRDREGRDPDAQFSKSIAEKVIRTGEPVVTASARDDDRMAGYLSVQKLMLQSVACVPIRAPEGPALGALYVETRLRTATDFARELPLLVAFADQVAIAIEKARLVDEARARAAELLVRNEELVEARAKLEELLGERTAELESTRRDLRTTRDVLTSHFGWRGLVGTSDAMRRVYALAERVKDTDVPVLLTGESGTGKEVVARAIHEAGPRGRKPFIGVNCGAIPEHLLESELFGHVRGAFTGADRDRKGLFREAEGGTILLDEIGEMPTKMQAGLLRVLQEKVVRPVGGSREQPVDVRVVAATNRDLEAMVANGTFREDLFYRVAVVEVRLPALRERLDDVPLLVDHFLGIFSARYKRERRSLSRAALRKLASFSWPGNVRQLENVLLAAWVVSEGAEIAADDLELPKALSLAPGPAEGRAAVDDPASLDEHKGDERERILRALRASGWNRLRAAEIVGIPRRTFYRRLKEYGIQ